MCSKLSPVGELEISILDESCHVKNGAGVLPSGGNTLLPGFNSQLLFLDSSFLPWEVTVMAQVFGSL